jgi:GrpB-like predicted nucleotidyltransferase (UPF0157 family)
VGSTEEDDLFEIWRARREEVGERIDVLDLYELLAESRGVAPDELPIDERKEFAQRALAVIWPGFEQVAAKRPSLPIELVASDPAWPARFERCRQRLADELGDTAVRIEHIGSTSVRGLDAKPVIDIQVSVVGLANEDAYAPGCVRAGYELYSRDDEHRFFTDAPPTPIDTHVHVCEVGGAFERVHLLFRDYLRGHADARASYATMKRAAAKRWDTDRLAYTYEKSDFILDLVDRARIWADETDWHVGDDR